MDLWICKWTESEIVEEEMTMMLLLKSKPSATVTNVFKEGIGPERSLSLSRLFGGHNLTVQAGSAPLSLIRW